MRDAVLEWAVVWALTFYDVVVVPMRDGFVRGVELARARYDRQPVG